MYQFLPARQHGEHFDGGRIYCCNQNNYQNSYLNNVFMARCTSIMDIYVVVLRFILLLFLWLVLYFFFTCINKTTFPFFAYSCELHRGSHGPLHLKWSKFKINLKWVWMNVLILTGVCLSCTHQQDKYSFLCSFYCFVLLVCYTPFVVFTSRVVNWQLMWSLPVSLCIARTRTRA